jgi:ribonuclease Z
MHIMKRYFLLLKCVDVLYHEATFLQSEESLAKKDITLHIQSSYNCIKANVKQLILGHYSTR